MSQKKINKYKINTTIEQPTPFFSIEKLKLKMSVSKNFK